LRQNGGNFKSVLVERNGFKIKVVYVTILPNNSII
jgi:hypothetical protein